MLGQSFNLPKKQLKYYFYTTLNQKNGLKLSVVIVNYNVKYFIEQALFALKKAVNHIDAEVFVVDNASTDGSLEMLRSFDWITLIENKENVGFSKANNIAMRQARGEYILLLNPDTVIAEDCLEKCIAFMEAKEQAGACGIKMLDGTGSYLPESKRGIPTPQVSFFKMTGLCNIFPKSKLFAAYYLGNLSENENNEVEILAGAFMLIKKSVLNQVGLFDEDYFMYGEDIDLSYRILKAGYKNYYFADSPIIHYKGESTKRGSLNYVRIFHEAMLIFAKKHFANQGANIYSFFIKLSITLKAVGSLASGFMQKAAHKLLDFALILAGCIALKEWYESGIMNQPDYYSPWVNRVFLPLYSLVWVLSVLFNGGYDKPFKIYRLVRGIAIGSVIIAVIYAFLPETMRWSRMLIILGSVWAMVEMIFTRVLSNLLNKGSVQLEETDEYRIAVCADESEGNKVLNLLHQSGVNFQFSGFLQADDSPLTNAIGNVNDLENLIKYYKLNEVVFCSKNICNKDIIGLMQQIGHKVNYKIFTPNGLSMVGSNHKNAAGDLYASDWNLSIKLPMNKRMKRTFDLVSGSLSLALFPILLFINKKPLKLLGNCLAVISGQKTWVSFSKEGMYFGQIKTGVLQPIDEFYVKPKSKRVIDKIEKLYARNYHVKTDFKIFVRNLSRLDTQM